MPRFLGYGFPFQYYRPYPPSSYSNNSIPHTPQSTPVIPPKEISQPPTQSKSVDPILFELFGIKLYFDDVLILSLLFFLYKEEVKDESLFLALILLLIS